MPKGSSSPTRGPRASRATTACGTATCLINTGFMYVIMYDAFQRLSTSLIAILSFIYPVVALFVDYAAFDHAITLAQGLGVVLILLSVCAVKFDWKLRFKAPALGAAS